MFGRALAFTVVLVSSAVWGAAPVVRQPTEKWVVNFDDAQCVASRNYGTSEQPLTFAIKAPVVGDVVQLAVMRPSQSGAKYAQQRDARIDIDGRWIANMSVISAFVGETKRRLVRINLSKQHFARLRTATTLSIDAGSPLDETFALDQMGPLSKVIEECVADLRKAWNVHDGQDPNPLLKQGPRGDLTSIFRADDYPGAAFAEEKGGTVRFAVLIDESGRVADCTVVRTSGAASLDAQSCGIIQQRARFTPAIGHDGKPAKSAFMQRVIWRLE